MTHKKYSACKHQLTPSLLWCANPWQLKQGAVIFAEADLSERERIGLHHCCYCTGPLQVPCLVLFLPSLPSQTLKKQKGKSSLALFLFFSDSKGKPQALLQNINNSQYCKRNHFFLLIIRGAETKQETDPDSPICFECMEFDFKSLPKITLEG